MNPPDCLPDELVALCSHRLGRHEDYSNRANEDPRPGQVQRRIQVFSKQVCSNQGGDDAEQTTPETCKSGCGSSDRCRECLWCPSIENGIEHTLEKVLHGIQSDV